MKLADKKAEILKEFYDRFADMPTSAHWYKFTEAFLSQALDEYALEVREEILGSDLMQLEEFGTLNRKLKCRCKYNASGEQFGLCSRCFKREMKASFDARNQHIKLMKEFLDSLTSSSGEDQEKK